MQSHWTDSHIRLDHKTGLWNGWDESGSIVICSTRYRDKCVEGLEAYSAELNGERPHRITKAINELAEM